MGYYCVTFFTVIGPNEEIARFKTWCQSEGLELETLQDEPCVCVNYTKWNPPEATINKMPGLFPTLTIDIVGHGDTPEDVELPCYWGRIENGNAEDAKVLCWVDDDDPEQVDAFLKQHQSPLVRLLAAPYYSKRVTA